MKASFNYTGRKWLDNSTFEIRLYEKNEAPSELEVALHKDQITDIPGTAVAWVEAHNSSKMMRFCLGSWEQSKVETFSLSDFDPGEPLLFRIKIVEENDHKHPIKGWRDRIRPVTYDPSGQQKKSVLPVYPTNLGHIVWRIDWRDPSRPVLQVNSRINDARSVESIVKKDPDFAALVFPQVIQEVLTRLLLEGLDDDEQNEWLIFAKNLCGAQCERNEDDEKEDRELIDDWVGTVVQSFGHEMELISRYIKFKEGRDA